MRAPTAGLGAFCPAVPFPRMPRWLAAAAAAAPGSPVGVPAPRFRLGAEPPCARAGSPTALSAAFCAMALATF